MDDDRPKSDETDVDADAREDDRDDVESESEPEFELAQTEYENEDQDGEPEPESDSVIRAVLAGETPAEIEGPLDQLPRGTAVGRYVILERLDSSATGTLYAAFDPELDHKIALKIIELDDGSQDVAQQRRETLVETANQAAIVTHPSVVPLFDVGEVGSAAIYVAMEFVDGIDLRQWMEARDDPFPWPEVLRVFREAGGGLAAAHAVGCVHGDFTPSHVLMTKGGRVCVYDFGLALPPADVSSPHLTISDLREGLPGSTRGEDSLLELPHAEEMAGTPDYMAPELHAGIEADALSDQFAFCAALYEALYGEPPFNGSATTIAVEAMQHNVRPAPPDSDVPQWLRDLLLRGLSPRRRDRFGSMELLLRELEHDPKGRRRRWVGGVALLGALGALGIGAAWLVELDSSHCEADPALLENAWDPETRSTLEDAFLASGRPHAEESWAEVESTMNAWSTQWLEHHTLACELMRVDDDAPLLEKRYACLDGILEPFAAFVHAYSTPSPAMVDQAQRVVSGLWWASDCREPATFRVAVPATGENDAKHEVDAAWLELLASDYDAARAQALETSVDLSPKRAPSPATRVRLIAGLAAARANSPDSVGRLHEAARTAASASLSIPLAHAWIELGRTDALDRRALWLDYAAALVEDLELPTLHAQLMIARGDLARDRSNDRDAISAYHGALAILEAQDARTKVLHADVMHALAKLALSREEWSSADQYLDEVIRERSTLFGSSHPELIEPLQALAGVQSATERTDEASSTIERALKIAESNPGHEHASALLRIALGDVETSRGQHRSASAQYETAVTGLERIDDDANLAQTLIKLGASRVEQGAFTRASGPLERALVLAERLNWRPSRRAMAWEALGRALADTRSDEAHAYFGRALGAFAASSAHQKDAARVRLRIAELPPLDPQ